jgi:hypothetical protein
MNEPFNCWKKELKGIYRCEQIRGHISIVVRYWKLRNSDCKFVTAEEIAN